MNIATTPVAEKPASGSESFGPDYNPATNLDNKPDGMSDGEWQTRMETAACYRLIDHFGMTDLIYNHITARVPGPDNHFIINAWGYHYSEITASNLVKVDLDGNVLDRPDTKINPAGYVIHACIHRARHDLEAVIHTHTRAGIAVSCMDGGLLPMEQNGFQFLDRIAYHDYEGIALNEAEQERLLADMGDCSVMILRNHGLLACGGNISQAFRKLYYLEMACRIQLDALNGTPSLPTPAVQQFTADQWETGIPGNGGPKDVTLEWPAMVRLMARKDPSFLT